MFYDLTIQNSLPSLRGERMLKIGSIWREVADKNIVTPC